MMGGLDTPTSGNVIVRDKELSKMNDEQLTIFRRRNIGFIFQNYNLVPILNVYENIVLPVELDGDTVDQKFLDEIVRLLGLEDKLKNMPNNLSGGQQQRVAIARALITKPAIELSEQGYHASYVYCDAQMMEIAKAQMNLLEGRVPEKANEVVVSEYFLSTYGNNAKIGDTVTLDTESFHGNYVVTGIMDSVNEKEANTCAIILSKAALTEWAGFDPAGYRAYAHFKNSDQLDEELMTSYCREIAEEYQLPTPSMNNRYFTYASKQPFDDFTLMAGVIALVLIGGYIVIQSIFRISINDKIRSYGQLRTIGATPKQIKRIVKNEGRKLGSIGILIGTVLGVCGGFLLFSKGFNAVSYVTTVILTLISSWIMVSISIRKPVKIAAGISPIEAVRFTPAQKDIRSRKKNIKLNPVSMGIANFKRDRKKTISIVASLSIGGILLMVVSSIVLVRSPEQIARLYFPDSDYKIYLQDLSEEMLVKGNPLNEELKQEVLSIDGVTDIIVVRQSLYASIKTDVNQNSGICDTLTGQNYAMIEAALTAGTMPTDSHSIVIHDKIVAHFEDMGVGSTVEFSSVDGKKSIPVTISGVFSTSKMPVIYGHGRAHTDGSVFFAPKDLFRELHPEITTFDYSWSIVSDPKKDETVKAELKNIVAEHSNLALDEIDTAIAAEKSQNSVAFGSMQVLSWLVFLFGVINLINTTLSNQMSRKQENSVLRSIGLTQKQLCKMNICEGLCYAFFATLAILIVGLPISVVVSREMGSATLHGKVVPYQFPVLEMGLFILVLFGMELILSVWTIRRQKKQSLIEQMRAME
jgi:putative ABC transport system permease protein